MRQKARRGELHLNVAVGYVKTDDDRIEKDADRRVQDGILLVFRKFAELQTIRQVLLWFREENVLVPSIVQGRGKRPIEWKAPVYHTLHHILTNPVYAGSYAYGRRGTRVTIEAGRKRVTRDALRRNWREWEVLIHDHHDGYITWADFETNQHLIADNANGKSYLGRGSIVARIIPLRALRSPTTYPIHGKGRQYAEICLSRSVQHQSGRQLHRLRWDAGRPCRRPRGASTAERKLRLRLA